MRLTREQLEAYSRGEVTRRELSDQIDAPLTFGTLLLQLHEHRLPLPRPPSDPQSPGVQLIKRLTEKPQRAG